MNIRDVYIADLNLSAVELNKTIYGTELPYIVFVEDAEKDREQIEKICEKVDEKKIKHRVAVRVKYEGKEMDYYKEFPKGSETIDSAREYNRIPLLIRGSVFSVESIRQSNIKFCESFDFIKEELFSIQFTEAYPEYYYISEIAYDSSLQSDELLSPRQSYEPGWYLEATEQAYEALTKDKRNAELSKVAQYALIYMTVQRFLSNRNEAGKQIFSSVGELNNYLANVSQLMTKIDDDVISKAGRTLTVTLGDIEYISGRAACEIEDIDNIFVKSLRYLSADELEQRGYSASNRGPGLEMFIYTRDTAQEFFELWVHSSTSSDREDFCKQGIKATITPVMVDLITFFANEAYELHAFHAIIPIDEKGKQSISFEIKDKKGNSKKCGMRFDGNWQSRLLHNNKGQYWAIGGSIIRCINDKIVIVKRTKIRRLKAEIRMILYLTYKKFARKTNIPENVLKWRILYWLTRSQYKNKRMWLYYDKLNDAGDNAEYAWRYALTQDDGIEKYYYLNKGTRDYERLSKEGYTMLKRGSNKAVMIALNAEAMYMTHLPPFKKTGISWEQLAYLKDLININIIRLYHGFAGTKQGNYTQIKDDVVAVVVGSTWEKDFYLQPEYGYSEDMIIESGMPRYDDLVNTSQKQILFAPTWTPALRDSGDKFIDTDYFKTYSQILANPRLIEAARSSGYKLVMFLHPMLANHTNKIQTNDVVKAVNSVNEMDYVTIMNASDLMITDYSSVHFDFAYMRKPVVYFQEPKLAPWREHTFDYEGMGFGEVCKSVESLVDTLCEYMGNACEMGKEYKARAEHFYLHDDRFAAKRLYEDVRRRLG